MKIKLAYHPCPICNSCSDEPIYNHKVGGFYYSYSICKNCGFIYQPNRYESAHYELLPTQEPENYLGHAYNRASYIYDFIKNEFDNKKIDLLDVGCSHGGVLHWLSKKIPNLQSATGYTLPAGEPPFFGNRLNIIYKNFEELEISDNSGVFNFVIMTHILEHFQDPIKAMKNVWKITKPGSLVYVEVPNFYWVEVRTPSVFTPEHLSYFTVNSIKNIFRQSGFVVLKMKSSRIWGNIKVLLHRYSKCHELPVKKENWRWILFKYFTSQRFYSYYRGKVKGAAPND